jgi:hypothetical protein
MIARGNSAALKGEVNEKVRIVRFGRTSWRGLDFGSAKELKQNKQAPAVSATHMTDSKLDKVAASTFGGGANNKGRLGSGIDGVWW